jgi:plasmid maintenance system killer protein
MEVQFDDGDLDRLETDPSFTAGHDASIVKGFRKVMQAIRATPDERDFYAMKSLHFENATGKQVSSSTFNAYHDQMAADRGARGQGPEQDRPHKGH